MAQVDYSPGVPSVLPQTGVPDDYQHIQTSPDEFGALVGRGLQKFGQGSLAAGDFIGKVAADDAYNQFTSDVQKVLTGDPDNTVIGSDGQLTRDPGFLGLQGKDALNGSDGATKQIEALRQKYASSLVTPQQQLAFENDSRRFQTYKLAEIGQHYEQQAHAYAGLVESSSKANALDQIATATASGDQEAVKQATAKLMSAELSTAHRVGGQNINDEAVYAAMNRARAASLERQVDTLAPTNPAAAAALLKNDPAAMLLKGPRLDALSAKLQGHANTIQGDQWIREANGSAASTPSTPPNTSAGGGGNWEIQHNNFSGLRIPGSTVGPKAGGFQSFATPEDNIAATSRQLDRYASGATTGQPLTTIRQIVSTWAPPTDNNPTSQLIDRAASIVGVGPDQQLNVADPTTKAKLVEAMIRGEQGGQLPAQASPDTIARVVAGFPSAQQIPTGLPPGAPPTPPPTPPPGMQDLASAEVSEMQRHARVLDYLEQKRPQNEEAWKTAVVREDLDNRNRLGLINAQKQAIINNRSAAISDYAGLMRPGSPYDPSLINKIATDQRLDGPSKENLYSLSEKQSRSSLAGEATSYGVKYHDTLGRIALPSDDPNRIFDPSQLIAMAAQPENADGTRDLNDSGLSKAMEVLSKRKSGPAGLAETAMEKSALDYAKQQLSYETEGSATKDQKGEATYSGAFVPAFYKYWNEGLSKGKTPTELADRKNLDALILPMMRSPPEMLRDKIQSDDAATAKAVALAGDLAKSPAAGLLRNGAVTREQFDKKYGTGSSDKILGAPPPPPAPVPHAPTSASELGLTQPGQF